MKSLLPLLIIFLISACNQHPVTKDKSLPADKITQSTTTYTTAQTLNAVSIWKEEIKLSSVLTTLFSRADSVELTAQTFQPDDAKTRPAIIYIHGGAFVHGSTGVADPTASLVGMEFAQRGYRVYSIEYRSMNLFAPSFIKAGYTAAQDGKAAIRYLVEHHAELNVDPDNIFLIGYSAGGITALNTAFMDAEDGALGEEEKLVRLYGPLSPVGERAPDELRLAGVVSISGGVLDFDLFDDTAVPICLIHGEDDEIIDPSCSLPFARASGLLDAGIERLSLSFEEEDTRERIRRARLDQVCGSKAIEEFSRNTNLNVEYHPFKKAGHFMLLSPKGDETEDTDRVLQLMSEFLYDNLVDE